MRKAIFITVLVIVATGAAYLYVTHSSLGVFTNGQNQRLQAMGTTTANQTQPVPESPKPTATSPSTPAPDGDQHSGMKLYHNDEYGFEFWYPQSWSVSEEKNINSYIPLNITVYPVDANGKHSFYVPFNVLVTTESHANRVVSYAKDEGTYTPLRIAGIDGVKLTYTDGVVHTDYIVKSGDNYIMLGNDNNEDLPKFNQIVASFVFLH